MAEEPQRPIPPFKKWRKFRKMSQETAAARLRMDRSNLSKIERAVIPYDSDFVEAGAHLYQCTPRDFQYRDPYAEDDDMVEAISNLNKEQQDHLRAIVATFPKRR